MTNGMKLFENFAILCTNPKVQALETTLVQSFSNFKDILLEFEEVSSELENYKSQNLIQKEKCESKSCLSSEALKQIIVEKDIIIQSIANILLEINETKNIDIVTDAFRILSGEQSLVSLHRNKCTPETPCPELESAKIDDDILSELDKEFPNTSEILSGRISPIIQTKKLQNSSVPLVERVQEKKKCPGIWPTPEKKMLKLVFKTPGKSKSNVKLRQARLNFVKEKVTAFVDLTCFPKEASDCSSNNVSQGIKKEIFEHDDTIMPSPTSGTINFNSNYKAVSKSSPRKAKKSLTTLRLKTNDKKETDNKENKSIEDDVTNECDVEKMNILRESNKSNTTPKNIKTSTSSFKLKTECTTFVDDDDNMSKHVTIDKEIEESINILRHFPDSFTKSPAKRLQTTTVKCKQSHSQETNESISLLPRINRFEDQNREGAGQPCSPTLRPSSHGDIPASLSILNNNFATRASNNIDAIKRTKPIEPIFKEPTIRKKAEKLALPGWSCDECKQFYDKLYKDDPEMLRQKMTECSRHRGRRDPARPRTPLGYWQVRWDVPNDTDEFNRLNDAI